MLEIVVVEDHPVFREGLVTILGDRGFRVVADVADADAAVAAVREHQPDVVLMDLNLAEGSGIDATRTITTENAEVAVLVVTMSEDETSIVAALRAGARGYLLKEASAADIARAVESVAAGDAVLGSGVSAAVLSRLTERGASPHPSFPDLTAREVDVLDLVARGLDNRRIADRLQLSEKTVRNRLSTILTKLHLTTRAEAVALARDNGLGGA